MTPAPPERHAQEALANRLIADVDAMDAERNLTVDECDARLVARCLLAAQQQLADAKKVRQAAANLGDVIEAYFDSDLHDPNGEDYDADVSQAMKDLDAALSAGEQERTMYPLSYVGVNPRAAKEKTVSLADALVTAQQQLADAEKALRESWQAVENLRGYSHVVTDGCEPSKDRGRHFNAHLDGILEGFRAALSAGEQAGETDPAQAAWPEGGLPHGEHPYDYTGYPDDGKS